MTDDLYRYESEGAVAEAERRGYLRGLEDAAKVADEHRAAFPECNDFTRGGDLVASKIAAAIRALKST